MKPRDITGQRFGRLIALSQADHYVSPRGVRMPQWLCRCDCGNERTVRGTHLRNGVSQSCGCLMAEKSAKRKFTHGQTLSREYSSWREAKKRCFVPHHQNYSLYGGRGITMAPEWVNDFVAFRSHIGPAPEGTTLDRINPDGDYEPGNVRWATRLEQANNRRNTRFIDMGGESVPLAEFVRRTGITRAIVLKQYFKKSKSVAEIIRIYAKRAATVAALAIFAIFAPDADARLAEGVDPGPYHRWFAEQMTPDDNPRSCCDYSDGHILTDDQWRIEDGDYQVLIGDEWTTFPNTGAGHHGNTVLGEVHNPTGSAVAWYLTIGKTVYPFCFAPGVTT